MISSSSRPQHTSLAGTILPQTMKHAQTLTEKAPCLMQLQLLSISTASIRLRSERETYVREHFHQSSSEGEVAILLEERRRLPLVPDSPCAPDAVDVLLDVVREVVVDDVFHLWDVEATGSDRRGDQDPASPGAEVTQGFLSLPLQSISAYTQTHRHTQIPTHTYNM